LIAWNAAPGEKEVLRTSEEKSGGNLLQRRGNVNFFTDDIFNTCDSPEDLSTTKPNVDIFENVPSETFHPLLS